MSDQSGTHAGTEGHRRFEREVARRLRRANVAATLRAGGIQAVWIVVLVAGAAVPLSDAVLDERASWVTPVLGFVIVIAAGVERIFSRTTGAAVHLDTLRRSLSHERRMLEAGIDVYESAEFPFRLYAQRVEERIGAYDAAMIQYNHTLLKGE